MSSFEMFVGCMTYGALFVLLWVFSHAVIRRFRSEDEEWAEKVLRERDGRFAHDAVEYPPNDSDMIEAKHADERPHDLRRSVVGETLPRTGSNID